MPCWSSRHSTAKEGQPFGGRSRQYASVLSKTASCQTLVSTTLASGEVPVMVGLWPFLPESWTGDPPRMARAQVPA
jgi:SRSO17 transposase